MISEWNTRYLIQIQCKQCYYLKNECDFYFGWASGKANQVHLFCIGVRTFVMHWLVMAYDSQQINIYQIYNKYLLLRPYMIAYSSFFWGQCQSKSCAFSLFDLYGNPVKVPKLSPLTFGRSSPNRLSPIPEKAPCRLPLHMNQTAICGHRRYLIRDLVLSWHYYQNWSFFLSISHEMHVLCSSTS